MISYYVIDAFSKRLFHGNPAGVCILETPLSEQIMQQIAFENNLAETDLFFRKENSYDCVGLHQNLKLICADTPHWQQLLFG